MKNRRNYYRILQVQPDAPVEIIRAGYRTLMRELKTHPDLGGSNWEASLLNEAYETLSDPVRRAAYDSKIRAARFRREAAAARPAPGPAATVRCSFCRTALPPAAQAGRSCPVCGVPLPSSQSPGTGGESRRTMERMKKNDPIEYSSAWPEVRKKGVMIDLSPKGMRFRSSEKLAPGTVLKITAPLLKACAVVTNERMGSEEDKPCFFIGVSFVAVVFEETRGAFFSAEV